MPRKCEDCEGTLILSIHGYWICQNCYPWALKDDSFAPICKGCKENCLECKRR